MGSLLDVNFADRQELKVLKDNDEVQLRVKFIEVTDQKQNPSRKNLAMVFDVADDPLVDDVRVWLPIPSQELANEDPKRYSKQCDRFEAFLKAFSLEMPIDTDAIVGSVGWAVLSESENEQSGEMQNGVRRFIQRR
jgi:hypothetical protein